MEYLVSDTFEQPRDIKVILSPRRYMVVEIPLRYYVPIKVVRVHRPCEVVDQGWEHPSELMELGRMFIGRLCMVSIHFLIHG